MPEPPHSCVQVADSLLPVAAFGRAEEQACLPEPLHSCVQAAGSLLPVAAFERVEKQVCLPELPRLCAQADFRAPEAHRCVLPVSQQESGVLRELRSACWAVLPVVLLPTAAPVY